MTKPAPNSLPKETIHVQGIRQRHRERGTGRIGEKSKRSVRAHMKMTMWVTITTSGPHNLHHGSTAFNLSSGRLSLFFWFLVGKPVALALR